MGLVYSNQSLEQRSLPRAFCALHSPISVGIASSEARSIPEESANLHKEWRQSLHGANVRLLCTRWNLFGTHVPDELVLGRKGFRRRFHFPGGDVPDLSERRR